MKDCHHHRRTRCAAIAACLLFWLVPVASAVAQAPVADESVESATQSRAISNPVEIGISAHGGIVDGGAGVDGFFDWGITFAHTVTPHLTLGITRFGFDFGYSSIEGPIWSIDFTPYLEAFHFVTADVQLFARLGLSMQIGGATNVRSGRFGASALLALGSRFWVLDWLSINVELGAYSPLTDPVSFGGTYVSPFTVAGTLGGGVGFHF